MMLGGLGSTPADAKPMRGERRVGLGGGIGDPFGPSLKIFLHPLHALQFDLGWAPMHHGDGITHVNYLFHIPPFVGNSVMDFGLYLGAGLGVAFWARSRYRDCYYGGPGDPYYRDCRGYGYYGYYYGHGHNGWRGAAMIVRAPVGLYFHWQKVPLDTVVEGGWSPYVVWWDPWHGDLSAKLRYYF
jgi:hypothetical protein